ncbi:MAG TPA: YegS/Rv2252/BmrU family lipid kinase [Ktedonobacteraceae bacterium]|nr:YegS/Rv2252/BmrU family lipid kinase [Ktedonobacteraceae bacterium]
MPLTCVKKYMRVALIFNPVAGTSLFAKHNIPDEQAEVALLQILHDLGIEADLYYTTYEDPGEGIARQLAATQTDLVIVAGGDGTIHSVAHGLLGSASVLGIIPAGTMNNLAYSLGIPEDLQEACEVFVHGRVCAIDAGRMNQHPFLEVAGAGLEAALFPAAEAVKSRGILSTLEGILRGLYTLIHFRPPQMSVIFNNERPRTYRAMQVTVCNSPYYGAHLNVAPGIFMNDGWLDVVLYTNFSKSEYILHALSISQGRRPFTPKIVRRRVQSLRIHTKEAIELQADGIALGTTPLEITVLPAAFKVLVPRKPVPGLLTEEMEQAQRAIRGREKKPMLKRKVMPEEMNPSRPLLSQPAEMAPAVSELLEHNVKPALSEAQQVAATTAVSGRKAVSRGMIILAFYFWVLSGAILFSWIARRTQFFPGDRSITRALQRQKYPWLRRLMVGISEPGFPRFGVPLAAAIAGAFWLLRFRLEAVFLVLSMTSNLLNACIKRVIKRPRPTNDLVAVARVINEPSFPSGHVMHYINLFGMLTYFLATNWRSGRLRNFLIAVCISLIALVGPSRVYLGAHWPSDVMAGYVYGGLWFGGMMALYLRVKAWIHPLKGETPEVMKPLQQPGDEEKALND